MTKNWKKLDHWIPEIRLYHYGKHINKVGDVSALCFKRPRAIDMNAASWTITVSAVTCPKCKAIIQANIKAGKKRGW